jgi:Short repeat of unknown function (DUF308)
MNDDIAVARAREAGEPRPCGSGRSTHFIPAVPAASSVTTIASIRHLPVSSSRLVFVRPGLSADSLIYIIATWVIVAGALELIAAFAQPFSGTRSLLLNLASRYRRSP